MELLNCLIFLKHLLSVSDACLEFALGSTVNTVESRDLRHQTVCVCTIDSILQYLATLDNKLSCLVDSLSFALACSILKSYLILDSVLDSLLSVKHKLIIVGNTNTLNKLMTDYGARLNVRENVIESVIHSNEISVAVIVPDVIVHRVVLAERFIILELFGVAVGKYELQCRTAFERLQERIVKVTFHVDRRTCDLDVSVKHYSEERNRCRGDREAAGVKCDVCDVVNVLPGVRVTARCHYLSTLELALNVSECLFGVLLAVSAVVRLILVKVGVQVGSERCY